VKQTTSVEALMNIIQKYADINNVDSLQKELKQYLYKPASVITEMIKPSLMAILKCENIQLVEKVKDWQEAIRVAAEPLRRDGSITDNYVHAMIQTVNKMGPYIVVGPKVAIPHARPEDGVNKLGMSFLKLTHCVPFSDERKHDVQMVIVLATIDGDTHLKALSQLSDMLSNETNIKNISEAKDANLIFELVKAYSNEK
jgi:mannitol operon transcriptional antiterminator